MNRQDFIRLIEEQGSDPKNWPAGLRKQIDLLLAKDPQAAGALAEYQELNSLLLNIPAPDFSQLTSQIANQELPEQDVSALDALMNWLFPAAGPGLVWRPALLACLPLVFGVVMSNYFTFGVGTDQLQQNWIDELAMLSLSDYSENLIEL